MGKYSRQPDAQKERYFSGADHSFGSVGDRRKSYSHTYYGEHTISVNENGIDPGKKELLAVARASGMNERRCAGIADEIYEIVTEELSEYLHGRKNQ